MRWWFYIYVLSRTIKSSEELTQNLFFNSNFIYFLTLNHFLVLPVITVCILQPNEFCKLVLHLDLNVIL